MIAEKILLFSPTVIIMLQIRGSIKDQISLTHSISRMSHWHWHKSASQALSQLCCSEAHCSWPQIWFFQETIYTRTRKRKGNVCPNHAIVMVQLSDILKPRHERITVRSRNLLRIFKKAAFFKVSPSRGLNAWHVICEWTGLNKTKYRNPSPQALSRKVSVRISRRKYTVHKPVFNYKTLCLT